MKSNINNLPEPEYYTVHEITELWGCSNERLNHYIQVKKILRMGLSAKGISNNIHTVYIDDDRDLIESAVKAFKQKLPVPSNYFKDGVRLQAKDIGVQHYDKLVEYTSNRSEKIKIWKESDYIYEDIANIQRAEQFFEPDMPIYAGGITWVDEEYDEKLGIDYFDPYSSYEYYVTGLDFEGDRFLLLTMDKNNEGFILRPILRSYFSIITREEKERFEIESGMRENHKGATEKPTVSNPLSIFSSMDNLKFTEITFKISDSARSIIVSIRDTNLTVAFSDLGLSKADKITPNVLGETFWEITRRGFDYKNRVSRRRLASLTTALKEAFDTKDKPFRKGVPRFSITNPSKVALEINARDKHDEFKGNKHQPTRQTPETKYETSEEITNAVEFLKKHGLKVEDISSEYPYSDED